MAHDISWKQRWKRLEILLTCCACMLKYCSGLNGRIPSRQRFPSGRLACQNVLAYGCFCNTIVVGLFMTNECKEYMLCENVAISMCVVDAETSVHNFLLHEHSECCKSKPDSYSNSRYYKLSRWMMLRILYGIFPIRVPNRSHNFFFSTRPFQQRSWILRTRPHLHIEPAARTDVT